MNALFIKLAPFLFKPSLHHPDRSIRLLALQRLNLNLSQQQQAFLAWLQQEKDTALIRQALPQFPHPQQLLDLLDASNANPLLHQELQHFWQDFFSSQSQQEPNLEHWPLLEQINNKQLLVYLINHLASVEQRLKLLEKITQQEDLLKVALQNNLARVRHQAAQEITQIPLLEALAKQATHDKNLLRLAKDKLQAYKEQQQAIAKAEQQRQQVLGQMRQLVEGADTNLYAARHEHLHQQWQEVQAQASSEEEQLFNHLHQQALDFIQLQAAEAEAAAQLERAEALRQEQLAAAQQLAQQQEQLHQELAQLLLQAERNNKQRQLQQQQATKQESNKVNLNAFKQQLQQLEQLLAQGNSRAALKLQQQLHNQVEDLPSGHPLANHLRSLSAQVAELKDWQGFVAAPKRVLLCEQMEALAADLNMLPQVKADKIKALQQEWRELGSAAVNRQLWERFQQAADIAYAPCKAWFAAQSQVQAYNQEQKADICHQLEELSASAAHLSLSESALEELLEQVHNEWHRFNPVNRHAGKQLAKRFQLALQPLKNQLHQLRQAHAAQKRDLITRAQELLDSDNLNAATEASKALQQEWRQLGRAPGGLEHQLWKEFRKLCDALFQKRDAHNKNLTQQRVERFNQAQQQLNAAREALATGNYQLAQQLYQEVSQLRDLPKKEQANWQADLHQLQQQLEQQQQQEQRKQLVAQLNQQLEQLPATGEPTDLQAAERLLVELELLLGQPSPAASQKLRLEMQIARMNSGLGAPAENDLEQELQQLVQHWHSLGGGHSSQHTARLKQTLASYVQG